MTNARFREMSSLMDEARRAGCEVVLGKNGHFKVYVPNGPMVVCAGTASDNRAIKNARAQLRRAGVKL